MGEVLTWSAVAMVVWLWVRWAKQYGSRSRDRLHHAQPLPNPPDPNQSAHHKDLTAIVVQAQRHLMQEQTSERWLTEAEERNLKACFATHIFYVQGLVYAEYLVLVRGNLRNGATARAYQSVASQIHQQFGDRFWVLLQPEALRSTPREELEPTEPKYVFAIVPKTEPARSVGSSLQQRRFTNLSAILTGFTLVVTGASLPSMSNLPSVAQLIDGGMISFVALLLILGCREIARSFAARNHRLRLDLPYWLPCWGGLGTLGTLRLWRDYAPNMNALADLGLSSAIATFLPALFCLGFGLPLSQATTLPPDVNTLIPNLMILSPKISFGVSLLGQLVARDLWQNAVSQNLAIALHPLAWAGLVGCFLASIHLLPLGILDGGHLGHALFGRNRATQIGRLARAGCLLVAFLVQPWLRPFAIFFLCLSAERSIALDETTELSDARTVLCLCLWAIAILFLVPVPRLS